MDTLNRQGGGGHRWRQRHRAGARRAVRSARCRTSSSPIVEQAALDAARDGGDCPRTHSWCGRRVRHGVGADLRDAVLERFGRVDVLCNNAGVSTFNHARRPDARRLALGVWGEPLGRGPRHRTRSCRSSAAGHARPHRQHRVDRRPRQRRRLHRPLRGDQGGRRVDLRDPAPGAGDPRAADRGDGAVPQLGRHQGDGVRAQPPGRHWI